MVVCYISSRENCIALDLFIGWLYHIMRNNPLKGSMLLLLLKDMAILGTRMLVPSNLNNLSHHSENLEHDTLAIANYKKFLIYHIILVSFTHQILNLCW